MKSQCEFTVNCFQMDYTCWLQQVWGLVWPPILVELPEEKTRRSRSGRSQRYNQLQIIKIIIRGMGQVTSNKNDTQSENQVVLFLVRSLESAMAFLSINRDRFSSVFVRKTRWQPTHTVSFLVSARKVKVKVRRFIPHKSKSLYFLTKNGDGGGKWMCSTTVAIYT